MLKGYVRDTEQRLKEIPTFERNTNVHRQCWYFGGKKHRLRRKRCFNVVSIVPIFVSIGISCPIIIIKGETDKEYITRVLAQEVYLTLLYNTRRCLIGYYMMLDMYNIIHILYTI
jgi:hypothetical protein